MFSNILFHKNFHLTCRCPKCGWPMCNEICAASPSHKPECEMTLARGHPMQIEVVSGKPFPLYETVAIMRCLHLKVSATEFQTLPRQSCLFCSHLDDFPNGGKHGLASKSNCVNTLPLHSDIICFFFQPLGTHPDPGLLSPPPYQPSIG